ncbi:MAG: helicase-related protein, partial [Chthoniobacterales bacterium]
ILLISPERLANAHFWGTVLGAIAGRVSLIVIDEAHCISDWGHDFRPHYRLIERTVRTLPANVRLLATTATANDRVLRELGPDVIRGDLTRHSLLLQTILLRSQAERLAWLADRIPDLPGSGIVYTLTVRDALQVSEWLQSRGIRAEAYAGELTAARRVTLEDGLLNNEMKVLVATTKLGMGFDKPDLSFVIHYQSPGSAVAYYQQVGRAGRALPSAYGILLSGEEETEITDYFIRNAFPTGEDVQLILAALEAEPAGLSNNELMERVNVSKGRIDKSLLLLSLESPAPVVKNGTKWVLVATQLNDSFWERAERLTTLRREEQRQMQDYARLPAGHMDFLIRALDGTPGGYEPPRIPALPTTFQRDSLEAAHAFLRRTGVPILPRKKWPVGGLPHSGVRGNIPEAQRAQEGRTLCVWGDAGWGRSVREGKYRDGRFSDELVAACAALVTDWIPDGTLGWVTCIPSQRHPELVPDFARRLADAIQLPFIAALEQTRERPEQKEMANSSQQARNVDGSLRLISSAIPHGGVLLVDDMVDSRWTLTLAAWLLASHGSGPVYPFALASTSHAE